MTSSKLIGLTASSAIFVLAMLAAWALVEATPVVDSPEDHNLWFEKDGEMEWTKKQLDPFQRGNKGRRGENGPQCGPPEKRRHQRLQP